MDSAGSVYELWCAQDEVSQKGFTTLPPYNPCLGISVFQSSYPCYQGTCICQRNSDSTHIVYGLPLYHPTPLCQSIHICQRSSESTRDYHSTTLSPLVRVTTYVRITLTVHVHGLALYHSTPYVKVSLYTLTVHILSMDYHSTTLPTLVRV